MTAAAGGLTIGEVATRAGVPATTLRYYETVGLLDDPPRVSGRRRYEPSVLDRLVVIGAARDAELTLAEIRDLLGGIAAGPAAGGAWRAAAARKIPEVEDRVRRLQAVLTLLGSLADCTCADLAQCAELLRVPVRREKARPGRQRGG